MKKIKKCIICGYEKKLPQRQKTCSLRCSHKYEDLQYKNYLLEQRIIKSVRKILN